LILRCHRASFTKRKPFQSFKSFQRSKRLSYQNPKLEARNPKRTTVK
jgi:hypothetical protein